MLRTFSGRPRCAHPLSLGNANAHRPRALTPPPRSFPLADGLYSAKDSASDHQAPPGRQSLFLGRFSAACATLGKCVVSPHPAAAFLGTLSSQYLVWSPAYSHEESEMPRESHSTRLPLTAPLRRNTTSATVSPPRPSSSPASKFELAKPFRASPSIGRAKGSKKGGHFASGGDSDGSSGSESEEESAEGRFVSVASRARSGGEFILLAGLRRLRSRGVRLGADPLLTAHGQLSLRRPQAR